MTRFIELSAEGMDAVKGVITLRDDLDARYLVSVDVTGCDDKQTHNRMKRAGEAFQRLLGGTRRVLIMPERDGVPIARVFALESDE